MEGIIVAVLAFAAWMWGYRCGFRAAGKEIASWLEEDQRWEQWQDANMPLGDSASQPACTDAVLTGTEESAG
jgi:hypothetical protein